jgi:hypothetical protein
MPRQGFDLLTMANALGDADEEFHKAMSFRILSDIKALPASGNDDALWRHHFN